MLKQVQHDSMHNVILNLVQDLSAEKDKKRLAGVMLKQVNFVQFAYTRHTQVSLALLSLNRNFSMKNNNKASERREAEGK